MPRNLANPASTVAAGQVKTSVKVLQFFTRLDLLLI
jgi:hypothetical protein